MEHDSDHTFLRVLLSTYQWLKQFTLSLFRHKCAIMIGGVDKTERDRERESVCVREREGKIEEEREGQEERERDKKG